VKSLFKWVIHVITGFILGVLAMFSFLVFIWNGIWGKTVPEFAGLFGFHYTSDAFGGIANFIFILLCSGVAGSVFFTAGLLLVYPLYKRKT
jgi:hypothetical protein